MPAPTTYTEEQLADYMINVLGKVADVLELKDPEDMQETVNDVLIAYGVTDINSVTDIEKLRVLARYHAWKLAVGNLAVQYDFQTDQQRFNRSQMFKQARDHLFLVEAEAIGIGAVPGYRIEVGRFEFEVNPYSPGIDPAELGI